MGVSDEPGPGGGKRAGLTIFELNARGQRR
jgi:hypothetical protein